MPMIVMFASARAASGTGRDTFSADCLGTLLQQAELRYGPEFSRVLRSSRVWVDGDEPLHGLDTPLVPRSEIAIVPPISGG